MKEYITRIKDGEKLNLCEDCEFYKLLRLKDSVEFGETYRTPSLCTFFTRTNPVDGSKTFIECNKIRSVNMINLNSGGLFNCNEFKDATPEQKNLVLEIKKEYEEYSIIKNGVKHENTGAN